jgi:hypothetical protein
MPNPAWQADTPTNSAITIISLLMTASLRMFSRLETSCSVSLWIRRFALSATSVITAPTFLERANRQASGQTDANQREEHRNLGCPWRLHRTSVRRMWKRSGFLSGAADEPRSFRIALMWAEQKRCARVGNYSAPRASTIQTLATARRCVRDDFFDNLFLARLLTAPVLLDARISLGFPTWPSSGPAGARFIRHLP